MYHGCDWKRSAQELVGSFDGHEERYQVFPSFVSSTERLANPRFFHSSFSMSPLPRVVSTHLVVNEIRTSAFCTSSSPYSGGDIRRKHSSFFSDIRDIESWMLCILLTRPVSTRRLSKLDIIQTIVIQRERSSIRRGDLESSRNRRRTTKRHRCSWLADRWREIATSK